MSCRKAGLRYVDRADNIGNPYSYLFFDDVFGSRNRFFFDKQTAAAFFAR